MSVHLVEPPLPRSYVAFLPVLAGEYPGAADRRAAERRLDLVLAAGCDLFLDLTEPGECEPYAHLLPERTRHVRLPIPAGGVPSVPRMEEIVAAIDHYSAAEGWFLYVHDANGLGRVGTAIGCWIGGMGFGRDPIAVLDGMRRHVEGPERSSPATAEQRAFVRRWAFERRRPRLQLVGGMTM